MSRDASREARDLRLRLRRTEQSLGLLTWAVLTWTDNNALKVLAANIRNSYDTSRMGESLRPPTPSPREPVAGETLQERFSA